MSPDEQMTIAHEHAHARRALAAPGRLCCSDLRRDRPVGPALADRSDPEGDGVRRGRRPLLRQGP